MLGVERDYKVPIPYNMDSNVLLVPYRGQAIRRTHKIPYVEMQAIRPNWNTKGIVKWKSAIGKLVPIALNPNNQMEGAPEHPTKSAKNHTHTTGA